MANLIFLSFSTTHFPWTTLRNLRHCINVFGWTIFKIRHFCSSSLFCLFILISLFLCVCIWKFAYTNCMFESCLGSWHAGILCCISVLFLFFNSSFFIFIYENVSLNMIKFGHRGKNFCGLISFPFPFFLSFFL